MANLLKWILPREDHFYTTLEAQGVLCLQGAQALLQFKAGASAEKVRDDVQKIEHEADGHVRQMEDALARTFVTPLDREDLHRLCSELDDVVDLTNLAARATAVYGVDKCTPAMGQLMDLLVACAQRIAEAVPALRKHEYALLIESSRALRTLEKEADVIFRAEVSALFRNPQVDAKELLRQKEVLEDIERAIDHCDNVSDLLTNLAVKNG